VGTFGNFGYKELYAEYQKLNPNVTIKEQVAEYNKHHEALQTKLVAGSGAPDIAAVDEGFIVQFRSQADKFANLNELGADKVKDRWLPWKWQQSLSGDGSTQVGLGTDVGGLAMCYRKDLFEKAGLPSDREEVAKLLPTWDAFIETGNTFVAKSGGAKWVDAATNMFNPILAQQSEGYFNKDDQLVIDSAPGVRTAWDTTMRMIAAKQSANLAAFSPQWNAGFKNGAFATVACPAWMMGYIKDQAPATAGKWDIAPIPGGGGNWGGSFLTIPKQGKNQQEAYKLAEWLTAPEQTLKIFKATGNLPSQVELYDNPEVLALKNDFFSGAPVGEIFTGTAESLQPQYLGSKNGPVRQAVESVIKLVEQGKQTPDAGWSKAIEDAKRAAA
jgi:cellobiose transport system substrate-binding protein